MVFFSLNVVGPIMSVKEFGASELIKEGEGSVNNSVSGCLPQSAPFFCYTADLNWLECLG